MYCIVVLLLVVGGGGGVVVISHNKDFAYQKCCRSRITIYRCLGWIMCNPQRAKDKQVL